MCVCTYCVHLCMRGYIDEHTLFTKFTLALLFWTCPVEEFRNISFPEIQFTFHDGRTWVEKKKKEEGGKKKKKNADCFS